MNLVFLVNHWDLRLLFAINGHHNFVLDYLMFFVSLLGEFGALWVILAFIILFTNKKNGRRALFLILAALLLTLILNDSILRVLIHRTRPFLAIPWLHHFGFSWDNSSFVSGHTATATAASVVIGHFYKKCRFLLAIFVALTMYSRVYLGMHYPSDVLGGLVLGLISGWLILNIFDKKQ